MYSTTNSKSQSNGGEQYWLKPNQVEDLRSATVSNSATYLTSRNDVIIQLLYDSGLRVGELVALNREHVDLDEGIIRLPPELQKDYPNDNTPTYTEIQLDPSTVRNLMVDLNGRWKDSDALFPSRQSDRMSEESVRNVVEDAAIAGGVEPYCTRGRGDPTDISPHSLRHSVAYRMLNVEDGNTLYDVTKRLRHATIQTTEREYAHFDRV